MGSPEQGNGAQNQEGGAEWLAETFRRHTELAIAAGIDVEGIVGQVLAQEAAPAPIATRNKVVGHLMSVGPSDLEIIQSNGG